MIFSMMYMMSEFFSSGTMTPAVLVLFLIVDVAIAEVVSVWADQN